VAHQNPVDIEASRVPIMDRAMLDSRTRPLDREPTPIWLRHRLQRRHMREATPAPRRAREWIVRLAGRSR
jgi:hypothetical protein